MGGVVGEQVALRRRGPARRGARQPAAAIALISTEAGVLADRPGAGEAQLDAVVAAGLCEAVNIAPGASSLPAAK